MSSVSVTAAMAADKFHCIISFGTPCIIQINDGLHTVKKHVHSAFVKGVPGV